MTERRKVNDAEPSEPEADISMGCRRHFKAIVIRTAMLKALPHCNERLL
jgi:hypothetical protein